MQCGKEVQGRRKNKVGVIETGGIGRRGSFGRRGRSLVGSEGRIELSLQLSVPVISASSHPTLPVNSTIQLHYSVSQRKRQQGRKTKYLSKTTFTDAIPCSCTIFSSTSTETPHLSTLQLNTATLHT